jgi:hypothetical protein
MHEHLHAGGDHIVRQADERRELRIGLADYPGQRHRGCGTTGRGVKRRRMRRIIGSSSKHGHDAERVRATSGQKQPQQQLDVKCAACDITTSGPLATVRT